MIKEVHICDRCGKMFEQCDIEAIPAYTIMFHEPHGWCEVRGISLDLCPKCQAEYDDMIRKWFKSANEQVEEDNNDTRRKRKGLLRRKSNT